LTRNLPDTGTLDVSGTVTGTGTIIVENGGALELGGSATPSMSFAGSNVTVTLAQPAEYHGILVGFGRGDTLILNGLHGTSATVINGNTLAVMEGGSTLDSVALAGNYSRATFTRRLSATPPSSPTRRGRRTATTFRSARSPSPTRSDWRTAWLPRSRTR
jgi:hypothetical protein